VSLTVGIPQGRSLEICGIAIGSTASLPDPGNPLVVVIREASRILVL
jgi:hypothetical protein